MYAYEIRTGGRKIVVAPEEPGVRLELMDPRHGRGTKIVIEPEHAEELAEILILARNRLKQP